MAAFMYTTLIDAITLNSLMAENNCLVLDCRFNLADVNYGQKVYNEGHIPGAWYLHVDHDLSSPITSTTGRHPLPDEKKLAARLSAMGMTAETQVVAYDDSGATMAVRAWWLLRWMGHSAVAVLDGGLAAWKDAGFKLETALPVAAAEGSFQVNRRAGFTVSTEALLQVLQQGSRWRIVDARAAERYRGEQEPIDPVAGRIPGAINRPLTDNLENGHFKSAAQLQQEWLQLLADTPVEQIVHMCGSGVTACHNQLAMEIAGLSGSRLYPGSWSEWIRDPSRPVETG